MKTKLTFWMILGLITLSTLVAMGANKKYYIVFTNFDDPNMGIETDHGVVPVAEYLYYESVLENVITRDYVTKASFNAATASTILDYDVAIFPMWVTSLNVSVDGVRVWDKIKEMLDNGKSVVVIGDMVVSQSVGSNAPSDIRSFFENELGISYSGATPFSNVGTPSGSFVLKAVDNDPVGWGYKKQCNIIYGENGVPPQPPIKWYNAAEFFSLKSGAKAVGFERVDSVGLQPAQAGLWAGARWEKGTARFVLWSVSFTAACGVHVDHMRVCVPRAIIWATRDIARPEAYCLFEANTIDFGIAQIGVPKTKSMKITNFGRTPLTISEFEFSGFIDDPEIYTISEGNETVTLQPLEDHTIYVDFKPKEKEAYEELLDVVNNGSNGTQTITLKGRGGEGIDNVPVIKLNNPMTIGSVPYGQNTIKNVEIRNVGKAGLIIEKLPFWTENSSKAFSFEGNVKVPITVMPENTAYLPIKFVALDKAGGTYTGEVVFLSNSYGKETPDTLKINAVGLPEGTGEGVILSSYNIEVGEAVVGEEPKDFDLVMTNNNVGTVTITVAEFQGDPESASMFSFPEINSTNDIPPIEPGTKYTLKIRFKPDEAKTYNCSLKLSGTGGMKPTTVPVSGIGTTGGYVNDIEYFELAINPNPVTNQSTITYSLDGYIPYTVKMFVYDMKGNVVGELLNTMVNPGNYSLNLNSDNYVSGKYVLVAEINGRNAMIPFAIVK